MCSGSDAPDAAPPMSALGVRRARHASTDAQRRGRFFNSANAFNVKLPPVPAGIHAEPARQALAADAPTGYVPCDQSAALACPWPATTPFMLARYARVRPGERLEADFVASGSLWYVIAGTGQARCGDETLAWSAGDIFHLPAGPAELLASGTTPAVLWLVTDEPLLAHLGLGTRPARAGAVHFTAADIAGEIDAIHRTVPDAGTSGMAVVFSSAALEHTRNLMPGLTLSLNTLPPHRHQPAHRHNSAALTLVIAGEDCHSRVDGVRCPWSPWATLVTPPTAVHSHHNDGSRRAEFLIVQDGGLYYQARTMGFQFME